MFRSVVLDNLLSERYYSGIISYISISRISYILRKCCIYLLHIFFILNTKPPYSGIFSLNSSNSFASISDIILDNSSGDGSIGSTPCGVYIFIRGDSMLIIPTGLIPLKIIVSSPNILSHNLNKLSNLVSLFPPKPNVFKTNS